jgi:hypothetical protein
VPSGLHRYLPALALAAAVTGLTGCSNRQQQLDDFRASLTSLRSTTLAVSRAWLSGTVSRAYTRTTLEATERMLNRDRDSLTSMSPEALSDPGVRALGDAQARLGRTLAVLWRAVDANDAAAVRAQLPASTVGPRAEP